MNTGDRDRVPKIHAPLPNPGAFIAAIGQVGSGKTSLLTNLLEKECFYYGVFTRLYFISTSNALQRVIEARPLLEKHSTIYPTHSVATLTAIADDIATQYGQRALIFIDDLPSPEQNVAYFRKLYDMVAKRRNLIRRAPDRRDRAVARKTDENVAATALASMTHAVQDDRHLRFLHHRNDETFVAQALQRMPRFYGTPHRLARLAIVDTYNPAFQHRKNMPIPARVDFQWDDTSDTENEESELHRKRRLRVRRKMLARSEKNRARNDVRLKGERFTGNVTVMATVQVYNRIPLCMRKLITDLIVFDVPNSKEQRSLFEEVGFMVNDDRAYWRELMTQAFQKHGDFLWFKMQCGLNGPRCAAQIYRNLDPVVPTWQTNRSPDETAASDDDDDDDVENGACAHTDSESAHD